MRRFAFTYYNRDGNRIECVILAASRKKAWEDLEAMAGPYITVIYFAEVTDHG